MNVPDGGSQYSISSGPRTETRKTVRGTVRSCCDNCCMVFSSLSTCLRELLQSLIKCFCFPSAQYSTAHGHFQVVIYLSLCHLRTKKQQEEGMELSSLTCGLILLARGGRME